MRKRLTVLIAAGAASLAVAVAATTLQNIAGTMTLLLDDGVVEPLPGMQVRFFDALNAEVLATATTDSNGDYDSGNIPIGSYRVHLADSNSSEFIGAGGLNSFCSGAIVQVLASVTSVFDAQVLQSKEEPGVELAPGGGIFGTVVDASTGTPLQGIRVSILDAYSAELITTVMTDAAGEYSIGSKETPVFLPAMKARFTDPGGSFFPEFHGADADAFCTAATVLPKSGEAADGFLDRVPPEHLTQQLADTVTGYDLPASVATMLGTSLSQVRGLLADDNPGNDAAACGQLNSFGTRVDVQERRGELSAAQASELRSLAANVRTALGCH